MSEQPCNRIDVPPDACHVDFGHGRVAYSKGIGWTVRDEMIIVDYDDQDRIMGFELVGPGKPCQGIAPATTTD